MLRSVLVFSLILLIGCSRPEEAPEFRGVRNIKVRKVEGTTAYLNADAHFFNPNDVKMKLKRVDIGVHLDGKPIGLVSETYKTKIPANAEFKVPLDATFDLKDTGVLKNLLSMLGGKSRKVRYVGYIRVAVHGVTVRVPVDYESEVKLNF